MFEALSAGSKWSGEDVAADVLPSLLSGANVAGFIKVADAMKELGDWWWIVIVIAFFLS